MMRQEDVEVFKKNIDNIVDKASEIFINNFGEPTCEEYTKVKKIIVNFIKEKKRIVYGGYAQNELIKKKNIDDDFYKDCRADIEFYSPEPIKDLIELVDILNNMNIFSVKGDEGVHPETYKLFANFENYCDISYMAKNIYDNLPTIDVNGVRMTHPHFMLIDGFRVYADPMTSYFRLDKTFKRFSLLEKHYPIEKSKIEKLQYFEKIKMKDNLDILEFIRHNIIMESELVVIGHYAVDFLVRKIENEDMQIEDKYPYYQIISANFEKDSQNIYNKLKNKYGKRLSVLQFTKFFMFLDNRLDFLVDGQVVLKIYGNNDRCIVNQYSEKKKTYFGTFQLIMLHLLIDYIYFIINKNKIEENNYLFLINLVNKAKDIYFDKNSKHILDDTNFKHFTFNCFGKPVDPIRESRLRGLERLKKGNTFKFSYVPQKGKKGKVPNFKFDNSSGNVQNKVNLIKL
jgi:hypothetical protein